MRRFAVSYVDRLLSTDDYSGIAELCAIISGSATFSPEASDYGLPLVGFTFVESLGWFAQSIRSGAVTYYEATTRFRQEAMLSALRLCAPQANANWYERGMADWPYGERIRALDEWISANDDELHKWLRELLREHRSIVLELTA